MRKLHLAKPALLARLPDDGAPGRTQYCAPGDASPLDLSMLDPSSAEEVASVAAASTTGSVLCEPVDAPSLLISPPFAIERTAAFDTVRTGQLIDLLARPRTCAVFLLRLGGFTVGLFRGEVLAGSKTDQRFVKNRHRKGGQSQRRFERIREKQVHELFIKACEAARDSLDPYRDEIEHVFLGGDRHTLMAFRKACPYFDRYGSRLMARVLPVAGDPRRASLEACPREISSSDVWLLPSPTIRNAP